PARRRGAHRRAPEPRDVRARRRRAARPARAPHMAARERGRHRARGGPHMNEFLDKPSGPPALIAITLIVLGLLITACGSSGGGDGGGKASNLPTKIGAGEGQLNVVAWEGYTQPEWVKPFEKQTGCQVHSKYAGSSDEMVTLMRQGGGSQYDLVSASGDASLRLIRGGNVKPVNVNLIPGWRDFIPQLKSPAHNTVDGKHYGVSLQWGPNTLLYNTSKVGGSPSSWSVLYDPRYRGQITVPDNPIQIADAALYLS